MAFCGIFAWTMDVWYCLLYYNMFYMYKVLLVYYFVFHLILLSVNSVLCFYVCCLFTCPLCCCFLCGSSAIGTKYPLTLSFSFFTTIRFLATLSSCCFPLCSVRFFQTVCLSFYKSDNIYLLIKLPQRISIFYLNLHEKCT